ncbi:MAG: hypothetical protein KGR26_02795 [Cyanobacteria bacterium REEB65]|nr:hypothetical protein [Cyanobacteria bacterium REEB65]
MGVRKSTFIALTLALGAGGIARAQTTCSSCPSNATPGQVVQQTSQSDQTIRSGRTSTTMRTTRTDTFEYQQVGTTTGNENVRIPVWIPDTGVIAVKFDGSLSRFAAYWDGVYQWYRHYIDGYTIDDITTNVIDSSYWNAVAYGGGVCYVDPATMQPIAVKSLPSGDDVIHTLVFGCDPILVDLYGEGKPDLLGGAPRLGGRNQTVTRSSLRLFDLDGSGRTLWQWVGPKVGVLAWDPGHPQEIKTGKQLFGNITWGRHWANGYAALASLDRYHTGVLTGHELDNLGIWVDANSDGVAESGEVRSLRELGITRLAVRPGRGQTMIADGMSQQQPDGKVKQLRTWEWFPGHEPAIDGSVYAYRAQDGNQKFGGLLLFHKEHGKLVGLSVPMEGMPLVNGKRLAFRLQDVRMQGRVGSWSVPEYDGISLTNQVQARDDGWLLAGRSHVMTPSRRWSYPWQAVLVLGKPLGG